MVGFCLEAESLESAINVRTSSSTNLHLNQGILLIPHREKSRGGQLLASFPQFRDVRNKVSEALFSFPYDYLMAQDACSTSRFFIWIPTGRRGMSWLENFQELSQKPHPDTTVTSHRSEPCDMVP